MEGLPRLQCCERRGAEDAGNIRKCRVRRDNQTIRSAKAGTAQECAEIEARREGDEFRHGHRIVGLLGIATFGAGPTGLCELGFEIDDRLGVRFRRVPADHAEHEHNIGLILRLPVGQLLGQIVVAIGQAHPVVADGNRIAVGRLIVWRDSKPEDRRLAPLICLSHQGGDVGLGLLGADRSQPRREGLGIQLFYPCFVHKGPIRGADLAGIRIVGTAGRGVLDQFADDTLSEIAQLFVDTEPDPVRGNLGALEPASVGVEKKVSSRLHRRIPRSKIIAPRPERRRHDGRRLLSRCGGVRAEGQQGQGREQKQSEGRSTRNDRADMFCDFPMVIHCRTFLQSGEIGTAHTNEKVSSGSLGSVAIAPGACFFHDAFAARTHYAMAFLLQRRRRQG